MMDTILRHDAETTERRDTVARRLGFRERLRRQSVLHRSQHQEDHLDRPQRQVNKHVNTVCPPPSPLFTPVRDAFRRRYISVPDARRRPFATAPGGWVEIFFRCFKRRARACVDGGIVVKRHTHTRIPSAAEIRLETSRVSLEPPPPPPVLSILKYAKLLSTAAPSPSPPRAPRRPSAPPHLAHSQFSEYLRIIYPNNCLSI